MGRYSPSPGAGLVFLVLICALNTSNSQGLPSDTASVLSAGSAAQTLASALQRAEQWRQQAKLRPSGACNQGDLSLCGPKTSAADDTALILATSADAFDQRDPKQTGGLKLMTPVLDQLECNTCTAFAVAAAAEMALGVGLRKDASVWFSPQDFFFCSSVARGTERTCRSSWLIEPALAALVATTPYTPECSPYAPLARNPCSAKCRDINPDVPTGRFVYTRLTSEVDMQQWMCLKGAVLSSMQVYPDFESLTAHPNGIYKGPGAGAKADEAYGHAVVLVGYNNKDKYWVVRSSWGPKVGTNGYFKVAYGVSGIADASNSWGLRFAPLKPTPAFLPSQIAPSSQKGCYNYKAATDDYFSKVADKFAVSIKQLVLDNLESVKDPATSLAGRTIKVCNVQEVADVLPPTSQAGALLRIKAAIDPNNLLYTWKPNSPARAYCSWQGITCDSSGNVVRISLSTGSVQGAKLGGVLPDAQLFLALPKLRNLRITTHDLVGTLPESYSRLTQVKLINLSGNKLRGTIPASWVGMTNIQELYLGSGKDGGGVEGNLLVGTLPKQWGSLANLRQIKLTGNQLTGTLPASWGSLQLDRIALGNNQLSGSVPNSWTPLITGQLSLFDVNNNRLSGTLKPEWGAAKSLSLLLMANNQFSGPIPNSLAKIPSLSAVNLSENKLTGTLPSSWDSKALSFFLVHDNKLTGPLPAWPAPNLVMFQVGDFNNNQCAGNQLSGQIPPNLPKLMPRLKTLDLPCNNLSGTLPTDVGSLAMLTRLDVSSNPGIQGTLPPSLGKLAKLTFLDITDTNIHGTVPDSFGALTSLTFLGLFRTKLSGCIPANMASMAVTDQMAGWKASSGIKGLCI